MGALVSTLLLKYHDPYASAWDYRPFCKETGVPLPSCIHDVLEEDDIGTSHVAVIGDVHGCLDELLALVAQLQTLTDHNCIFVFCGDIVNKGPHNKATLDFVRGLGSKARAVRGNHEDHVVKNYIKWKSQGSLEHFTPKYEWITKLTDDDFEYLKELPYTISIPSLNSMIVHAGLNPYKPLYDQTPLSMTKMRTMTNLSPGEKTHASEGRGGIPWAELWTGPQHVYFGHDAKTGLQQHAFATGLDTGCVYGRALTAQLLTGARRLVQAPAKCMHKGPAHLHKSSKGALGLENAGGVPPACPKMAIIPES